MKLYTTVRIIGLILFGIIGLFLGPQIGDLVREFWLEAPPTNILFTIVTALLFGLLGYIITPWITISPLAAIRKSFSKQSPQTLFAGMVGLVFGLVAAALLAYPISLLPQPLGRVLPFAGVLIFGYLGITLFVMRQKEFVHAMRLITHRPNLFRGSENNETAPDCPQILVDTSAIIDGRIVDIAKTGFITGSFLIPRFVLTELQYVSDSADNLRRQRGRRGLEILGELQKNEQVPVNLTDEDPESTKEVDEKLVILAREMNCPILTNDYNLNRVAELQGIKILNVNELANAVKSILLPGESLNMKVIQEGKEFNQGVGYMQDGTMVVIENGQKYLNRTIPITVTKILQTAAGRMIFAKPDDEN